jgi:hypothetical protein
LIMGGAAEATSQAIKTHRPADTRPERNPPECVVEGCGARTQKFINNPRLSGRIHHP